MTIRKGEPWGAPGVLPADGVAVRSDAEARRVVEAAWRAGSALPALGLLGGDLCRTLGGVGDEARLHDGTGVVLPCDVGQAELDGDVHLFVAHLAAHRGWWRGRAVVVMNAAWLGPWNAGPRAHPNDGLLDVTEATVALGQRRAVERRLRTGSHLPHPGLRTRRVVEASWHQDRPVPVHLDGEAVGEAIDITVRILPDALTVVV